MKRIARFETEAALCTEFLAWVKRSAGERVYGVVTPAWVAYAETAGWDVLLVAPDGTQIGVQAKLRFNLKVLAQSLPEQWSEWHDRGPDYRAVLVPDYDGEAERLCAALGLMLISRRGDEWTPEGIVPQFGPGLDMEHGRGGWHYWSPSERCKLPEFVPDVPAGASGPVQLTTWKVAALRVIALLELRGHVTRKDFADLRLDSRRWTGPSGWLLASGTPGQYLRGPELRFDQQHPQVYAEVLTEMREKLEDQQRQLDAEVSP
jgi:hypothetical protein